uniref:Neprosin PEP catalytic domain-containing protein n=2 Tax=Aegilops tauschii subsp. strangulata TaxID=200361 RepID=A0A452Y320_AEGTS
MENCLQHIVLYVLLLANVITGKSSPTEQGNSSMPWPSVLRPMIFHTSENLASDQNSVISYITSHVWTPRGGAENYYGIEATIDVYGFNLQPGQLSAAGIWILNKGDGKPSSANGFQVGWSIFPRFYKDSHTHFYTSWTSGGSPAKSCSDMICPGFQKTSSSIAPGSIINPVSDIRGRKSYITIRVFKDKSSGDWHVHYGLNGGIKPVGYFPKSLIPGLIDRKVEISFGGYVSHQKPQPSPPMGSGYAPASGNAASFKNIKLIDANGNAHLVNTNLPFRVDPKRCYPISYIDSAR